MEYVLTVSVVPRYYLLTVSAVLRYCVLIESAMMRYCVSVVLRLDDLLEVYCCPQFRKGVTISNAAFLTEIVKIV